MSVLVLSHLRANICLLAQNSKSFLREFFKPRSIIPGAVSIDHSYAIRLEDCKNKIILKCGNIFKYIHFAFREFR